MLGIAILLGYTIMVVEVNYSPRIEITRNRDVLLWYNNNKYCREYVKLFNF
jgi:hypothetical protein